MASFILNLFVLIVVLAITSAKERLLHPRIVGGYDVTNDKYPYQVSLQHATTNQHFCGGVIVSKNFILTSSQCVDGLSERDFIAVYGTMRLSRRGLHVKITDIYTSSEYDQKTIKYDVTMLLTEWPIQFDAHVRPVELPTKNALVNQTLIVSGWGVTKPNPSAELSDKLQFHYARSISLDECRAQNPDQAHRIHSSLICTMATLSHRGVCVGDLGDPLVSEDNILYGIVSLFDPTCKNNWPDVYTSIYAHIGMIRYYVDSWEM